MTVILGDGRSPHGFDIKDPNDTAVLVDPVDDSVGAAPGAVATGERPEQGLADLVGIHRKHGSQNSSAAAATVAAALTASMPSGGIVVSEGR